MNKIRRKNLQTIIDRLEDIKAWKAEQKRKKAGKK